MGYVTVPISVRFNPPGICTISGILFPSFVGHSCWKEMSYLKVEDRFSMSLDPSAPVSKVMWLRC